MNKHNNNKHLDPVYKQELANYFEEMSKRVLVKEGKNFEPECLEEVLASVKFHDSHIPRCDCGTRKTHGKVPLDSHAHWCRLRN